MLVMKKEDMFANKLITLLERKRTANRDLFDLYYFFSEHWDINEDIIRLRTGYGLKEYLKNVSNLLKKLIISKYCRV